MTRGRRREEPKRPEFSSSLLPYGGVSCRRTRFGSLDDIPHWQTRHDLKVLLAKRRKAVFTSLLRPKHWFSCIR